MAIEVKTSSLWDTLRLQWFVTLPAFLSGLVVPNRGVLAWRCRHGAGASTLRFLARLREKYCCDHLWMRFPLRRTLVVFAPDTIDAILRSDANAADPTLKKGAFSTFIPGSLVISSGDEWRDRRRFNEAALDTGKLHRHHAAFGEIVVRETDRWLDAGGGERRWTDFRALALRTSHQLVLGNGQCREDMSDELARMSTRGNILLRDGASFTAFYAAIERYLAGPEAAAVPAACLMHESAAQLADGRAGPSTSVPTQIGFWFFVLKDALELHLSRTLALIAAHPDVQARARGEARAEDAISAAASGRLPYIDACLREQLRLWTPVPLLLRRASRDFSLRDEIPVGEEQQILIHAGFLHRDPRIFGARADAFAPDAAAGGPPTYFFSDHRQRCAGAALITFVLGVALASLLRRFRFQLVGPDIAPGRIAPLYNHFDVALRAVADP